MRKWINKATRVYLKYRYQRLAYFIENPHKVQERWFQQLMRSGIPTAYGKQYQYRTIKTQEEFARRVPIRSYEEIKPYIIRMMEGERDVLWSGQVNWFAKSSGTTSSRSKFIPVSWQNLRKCHIRGSWDTMNIFYHLHPNARQFECKTMIMGGSWAHYEPYPKTRYGDVSAIMIHQMPTFGKAFYTPDFDTALMSDWEQKLERMAHIVSKESNMVAIGGVPTWTLVLFRRILELTGKKNMLEVWPDFQVYIHGGVSFMPYREQFEAFFPSDQVNYLEIYNASEGYFGIQNDFEADDLLLLLDNGIYYEFLPMEEWHKEAPQAIPLRDVEVGKNYAMVITTNAGLWRYIPGDTVTFTSTNPYKIKITGRTKQFVNAFGEEVIVENTDKALAATCSKMQAIVRDYTVAPFYFKSTEKGGHEWLVEFEKAPRDLEAFQSLLDHNLQKVNSDYEAKRFKGLALEQLVLRPLPEGTFHNWLRSKGKLGGQHKVPRLANDRTYVEEILNFIEAEP